MKRRSFLRSSLVTASLGGLVPMKIYASSIQTQRKKAKQQFYELRVYTLKDQQQQRLVETYFQNAAIPALNRLGSKTVGVFTEQKPEGQTRLFALIPFESVEDFIT